MKKLMLMLLLSGMLLVIAGCGEKNDRLQAVTIGYFPNASHAPAMVGLEQDLFRQELAGLGLQAKTFANGSLFMDALTTGQIDFGYVGPGPVINRYLQGGEVVVLAGASQGENVLVVRSDLKFNGLHDLEGKVVATPSTGCTHDLILRKMLQEEGMAVEENGGTVKRLAQKPATMVGLFQQKQIDAALVSEPWASIMEALGVVKIVREADEVPWEGKLPAAVFVARKDFLTSHPDQAAALIITNQQAIEFINQYKEEAAGLIARQIKEVTNEVIAEDIILNSMERVAFTPELDKVTLQEFANLSHALGFVETDPALAGLYR
ncbi:MAG: aliphatic sulfonate ABC transporter substrate-binding protein [Dethiobacteraceae bacterium]|jgi:NitT/TauT family transport system substrate-binding protein